MKKILGKYKNNIVKLKFDSHFNKNISVFFIRS